LFKNIPEDIKSNWLKWKAGQATNPVGWNPNSAGNQLFQSFYDLYSAGFEVYYAPKVVLRANGVENTEPDQSKVGVVDDSWSDKVKDLQIPTSMNFILTSARGTQEGDMWRNAYEWLGSAVNGQGWDADIYGITVQQ
jgi:hypothetical protein